MTPLPNGDLWSIDQRLQNAVETLKLLDRYRDDAIFRPGPFQVRTAVSAAEEALGVLKEMCDLLLATHTHVTHGHGPSMADLEALLRKADLIR